MRRLADEGQIVLGGKRRGCLCLMQSRKNASRLPALGAGVVRRRRPKRVAAGSRADGTAAQPTAHRCADSRRRRSSWPRSANRPRRPATSEGHAARSCRRAGARPRRRRWRVGTATRWQRHCAGLRHGSSRTPTKPSPPTCSTWRCDLARAMLQTALRSAAGTGAADGARSDRIPAGAAAARPADAAIPPTPRWCAGHRRRTRQGRLARRATTRRSSAAAAGSIPPATRSTPASTTRWQRIAAALGKNRNGSA